jgi:hypothetical protein
MKRSSSLKRRVKAMEEARGTGAVTLTFADDSKQGFNFSQKDRLKLLLASFDIARSARNHEAQPDSSPRAREIALAISRAQRVTPPSRLWETIAGIIRNAEADCTTHAPDPASD